jgi:DMSO/TMAO reductase YedYZ heme-binding membrane subunit
MSAQLAWHVARAAGLVAWALTAAAVIWGLLLSTRVAGRRPPPAWLADLHRYLGGVAVSFTAIHIGALLADTWVHFDIVDIVVPFASQWRPAAVAGGVVAMYLLAAVEITSLLRRRLSTRSWRTVHMTSFALFVVGTVHLLTAGTDATSPWVLAAVGVAVSAVVYLTTVRVLTPRRRAKRTAPATSRTATPDRPRRTSRDPMPSAAATGATTPGRASRRSAIRSGA